MSAVLPCAELVAPVANMLAAAVAAGRVGVPSRPAPSGAAAGDPPAETSQEVSGEGRGQGGGPARQPDRADLRSAVDDGAGPGAHRVDGPAAVSYTHLRAHETVLDLVCRLLLEKKKKKTKKIRN